MTPLSASLGFVVISLIISSVKHFLFPSNNLSSSTESSIEITKLYTISDKKPEVEEKPYKSFYEAYYGFHVEDSVGEGRLSAQVDEKIRDNYNGMVLKESLINDQHTVLCEEDYLVTISEGISCEDYKNLEASSSDKKKTCGWVTEFQIYQLPLLDKATKETIRMKGRIGLTKINIANDFKKSIECKKIKSRNYYLINFPLSHFNSSSEGAPREYWELNDLYISKLNHSEKSQEAENKTQDSAAQSHEREEGEGEEALIEQEGGKEEDRKKKKKEKNIIKEKKTKKKKEKEESNNKEEVLGDESSSESKKSNKKPQKMSKNSEAMSKKNFECIHIKISLKRRSDRPHLHFSDGYCAAYVTQDEPWLVRYNCDEEWQELDILQDQIQDKVYEKLNLTEMMPPFERFEGLRPKYLFTFDSVQRTVEENCEMEEKYSCLQEVHHESKYYLTVIYLHTNNKYRVEKFFVQLTFLIGGEEGRYSKGNEPNEELASLESYHKEEGEQELYENSDIVTGEDMPEKIGRGKKQQQQQQEAKAEEGDEASSYSRLVSHAIIISEINPNRLMRTDCELHHRSENYYERYYDRYYWLYENRLIGSVEKYCLVCVIVFDLDEHIRMVEVEDILHSPKPRREIDYFDWKSLKEKINYEEEFEKEAKLLREQQEREAKEALKHAVQGESTCNGTDCAAVSTKPKGSNANPLSEANGQELEEGTGYLEAISSILWSSEEYSAIFEDSKRDSMLKMRKQKKKGKKGKQIKRKSNRKGKDLTVERKKRKEKEALQKVSPSTPKNTTSRISFNESYPQIFNESYSLPYRSLTTKYKFPLPFLLSIANNMEIINPDPEKPLILFNGVKQHLFTYTHRADEFNASHVVVDYRYLPLSNLQSGRKHSSLKLSPEIKTAPEVTESLPDTIEGKDGEKLKISISDETNPGSENVLEDMYNADQNILHQIKAIKAISVELPKNSTDSSNSAEAVRQIEIYRKYVVVVWGWGVEVYEVNWDKNGLKQSDNMDDIDVNYDFHYKPSFEYFIPFLNLFATFYCMFQAIISSR